MAEVLTAAPAALLDGALVISHEAIVVAAVVFGMLAFALAVPVPVQLSRAAWPTRAPVLALLVWQGVGLGGGVSMIGALALAGYAVAPRHPLLALVPAIVFAGYLLAHLAVTAVRVGRQRRRHLEMLELLSSPHPTRARMRVIDESAPVAYSLHRGARSVTVLSQGLLDRLDADELVAVVAHERAHLDQRHDLLQLVFRSWRAALPWFPIAARAEAEVAALVEMLADDHARREVHDEVLARAILAVGCGVATVDDGVAVGGDPLPRRIDRYRRLLRRAA